MPGDWWYLSPLAPTLSHPSRTSIPTLHRPILASRTFQLPLLLSKILCSQRCYRSSRCQGNGLSVPWTGGAQYAHMYLICSDYSMLDSRFYHLEYDCKYHRLRNSRERERACSRRSLRDMWRSHFHVCTPRQSNVISLPLIIRLLLLQGSIHIDRMPV